MKRAAILYALLCLGMLLFVALQFVRHTPLQTQLTALLPQETANDPVWLAADRAQQRQLNGSVVLLIGAAEPQQAFQAAKEVAQHWRNSGQFVAVDAEIEPDLARLRQSAGHLGAAVLPPEAVRQLYDAPQQYFGERAEAAVNPFSGSLLPLDQDWLGFGRFVGKQQEGSRLNWQPEQAMLYSEAEGKTWVWLRARLNDAAPHPDLLQLLQQTKQTGQAAGYEVRAAGGALFAADARQTAERESTWMSAAGLLLTFGLLLAVFRSWRLLLLLLPLSVGMLAGLAVSLAVFGEIHALTVVVGTSLIGVLVDFPLHWLAPSLFGQPETVWDGRRAMRRVLPGFVVSLTVTVAGYVLLWFTPLPVLRQTAVFSAAALLGAFAATVLFLPPLFAAYRPQRSKWLNRPAARRRCPTAVCRVSAVLLAALLLAGVLQSRWQDDIRQWMTMRADLLADAQQIARISGMGGGQTVLLQAASADDLLNSSRLLEAQLPPSARLFALHQWVLPTDEQQRLQQRLHELAGQPETFAPLTDLGVPVATVQAALTNPPPPVGLADSLAVPQAQAFAELYLGEINGRFAALARIEQAPEGWVLPASSQWQLLDKRADLNRQFADTRNQAAWLKLASFALAGLVLWRLFGRRMAGLILWVPACAVGGSIGVFGWLGLPIGLFAMFGLLLVAAIGVDYAVYALKAPEPRTARIAGISLAATTTGISFALLAASSTPAVAAFGVSVTCGVAFNWLAAVWLAAKHPLQAA